MLRKASWTGFIHTQISIPRADRLPFHRTGAAIFVCNYSTANRIVYVDYSTDGTTWTAATVVWPEGTGTVVPYGILVGAIRVPSHLDMNFWRVRLDAAADGDGVFVELQSASPVPDHPLL